ncbi:MAG: type I restriction endonuclease subunit R [Zunongwangia sp.]|jgi:type I restriction enzyme R subunit|uniref:Type I restriction enzyme endonuclease subunit n=3 Tax=Zunongwangia profunda TaxID=398743 RepID=D5BJP9_ZUNPS|nr:type I restriction endonuclease subunit R [Zunongwangia profunda]MAO36061.1 type I restriction endonuclease subunit R [Zunongwangia sp.]MBG44702.1 type I restriction endonuclease subunit R [Aequorivita sp.]ADF53747.1 restriction endonuclease [Zunongwangia profunda SM-A87]MAS70283.1 type I restriction endonuclease subunit R [Zunongwangia sp.]MCC4229074.1 type I restriction endonuclease subunit R [Zunongwangia profunda]|tara:strand:+ start:8071 stop:11250 length:3180 start_codon:yes stop_codon:yes gene_type:complete
MNKKFTEAQLESVFATQLEQEGYQHQLGGSISRKEDEVLIESDLRKFLMTRYRENEITKNEVESIILRLKTLPASVLYESNKEFMQMLSDGFSLKREDRSQKDIWIYLIDYSAENKNTYKFVNQLEITGTQKRIPDGILYINGIPVVVFEFKTAIQENTSIYDAYIQLTVRYERDIPELFKYNAFCVISDGVNTKAGSFFAPYEFFYAWRRIAGLTKPASPSGRDVDGIDSMFTLIQGMLHQNRLRDIIKNFIYLPDSSKKDEKIVCRYPQYYAARALFENIQKAQKPAGNGKGGTYFGATGSGKSYTMLFLTRLLMKSSHFESPTIILITDRTDLDDQLAALFTNAKAFIGDDAIASVESRADLRKRIRGRESGGVFLTTIHKFTEDTELLTNRSNVICISDEAHRSQTNLDQKIKITEKGVQKTFGFAKYLHDSLPNATFVGFTGTPIDATLDVFGKVVDEYTMTESVKDEITVRIVYEGRSARVALENRELQKIEDYYRVAEEEGANEYQVEDSKKQSANMNAILGDPDRLQAIAEDFVQHYEKRLKEGATVKGKAIFVCSNREIAYDLYKNIIELRPEWAKIRKAEEGAELTEKDRKQLKPIERIKMIMTRGKDDPKEMYDLLGTKEYRKELDRQFKNEKSNFKIAIVVDMWLTGFDVPFLDSIYIDKPIQQHNLIQTISRVNRKFQGKNKGLVVDYIGIKKQMNLALAKYNKGERQNFEDIERSLKIVRDHLDLLARIFHKFDSSDYFRSDPVSQLNNLNQAVEYVQQTKEQETRFMNLVKRLKAAYDICAGSEKLTQEERDYTHFYLAIKSIVFKLTKGNAPDTAQMNAKVREMIKNALASEGVEEIFKMGDQTNSEQDIFDEDYLAKIDKIKLPNTKIKLLQQLLVRAIDEIKKVNKVKGVDFSRKMEGLVSRYNERKGDVLRSEVYEEMAEQLTDLIWQVQQEFSAGEKLGIDFEEKAFYDILKELCIKYDFQYPENKLIELSKAVKDLVDEQAKFPDWSKRNDIKSALKVGLILLLDEHGYPPVERDEVYEEIFEQAENFKKNRPAQRNP